MEIDLNKKISKRRFLKGAMGLAALYILRSCVEIDDSYFESARTQSVETSVEYGCLPQFDKIVQNANMSNSWRSKFSTVLQDIHELVDKGALQYRAWPNKPTSLFEVNNNQLKVKVVLPDQMQPPMQQSYEAMLAMHEYCDVSEYYNLWKKGLPLPKNSSERPEQELTNLYSACYFELMCRQKDFLQSSQKYNIDFYGADFASIVEFLEFKKLGMNQDQQGQIHDRILFPALFALHKRFIWLKDKKFDQVAIVEQQWDQFLQTATPDEKDTIKSLARFTYGPTQIVDPNYFPSLPK